MGVQNLKYGDVLPVLRVPLLNSDGTPHDNANATTCKLNIERPDGVRLQRDMAFESKTPAMVVTYAWVATDWDAPSGGAGTRDNPYTAGGLIQGPSLPLVPGSREARMEYVVWGAGGPPGLTFPNGAAEGVNFDTLRIGPDIA